MELMTVREVARALKVSPRHVFKLAATGKLPKPVMLDQSLRWRATDIALFTRVGCHMGLFRLARVLRSILAGWAPMWRGFAFLFEFFRS